MKPDAPPVRLPIRIPLTKQQREAYEKFEAAAAQAARDRLVFVFAVIAGEDVPQDAMNWPVSVDGDAFLLTPPGS